MIFEKFYNYKIFNGTLAYLLKRIESSSKLKKNNPIIINFLNPHSYIISLKDYFFHKSLLNANFNLIDGIGIYLYFKFFKKLNCVNRITGYDLFESLIKKDLKFFFLGGNKNTSQLIKEKLLKKNVRVETYSPSFSSNFSSTLKSFFTKLQVLLCANKVFLAVKFLSQDKHLNFSSIHLFCIFRQYLAVAL